MSFLLKTGFCDIPTVIPQMMDFNSYFLQSSLRKILNQLTNSKLEYHKPSFGLNDNSDFSNHEKKIDFCCIDETSNSQIYDTLSHHSKSALISLPDSESILNKTFECDQESTPTSPTLTHFHQPKQFQELDTVRRLLETVNSSVTKQLLEANVRKLSSSPFMLVKQEVDDDYNVSIFGFFFYYFIYINT